MANCRQDSFILLFLLFSLTIVVESQLSIEKLHEYQQKLRRLTKIVDFQIMIQTIDDRNISDISKILTKRSIDSAISTIRNSTSQYSNNSSIENGETNGDNPTTNDDTSTETMEIANCTTVVNDTELSITNSTVEPRNTTESTISIATTNFSSSTTSSTTTKVRQLDYPKNNVNHSFQAISQFSLSSSRRFKPTRNRSVDECHQLSQSELVAVLKEKGTYNPDFMAWDVSGVIRFLDKATSDQYERNIIDKKIDANIAVEKNLNALERILRELGVQECDVRSPKVIAKLYNLRSEVDRKQEVERNEPENVKEKEENLNEKEENLKKVAIKEEEMADGENENEKKQDKQEIKKEETEGKENDQNENKKWNENHRSVSSPTIRRKHRRVRREDEQFYNQLVVDLYEKSSRRDEVIVEADENRQYAYHPQTGIGRVHMVPLCDKRGAEEDGYLRLCGACQAIRHLPDEFFPPFINEVLCDQDKACLYFYDYPHGKCKQKFMNFVVLRNVGSQNCQIWHKFNLNVRVSCECFVDEMSFFAKYV